MKKWYAIFTAVLGVVCMVFLLNGRNNASAANTQELISGTLQKLGISDARSVAADDADCLVYVSADEGMSYYFNAETAVLEKIMNDSIEAMELEQESMALEPDVLRNAALEFAANCIAHQMIGELFVTVETVSGDTTTYEIIEKYNGIPTGTKIGLIYRNDGVMFGCAPHYGSVFVKKADGRVELVKGDDFIGEDEAIACAVEALCAELDSEIDDSVEIAVEMEALGGELFYSVVIQNADRDNSSRVFDVEIDAYTGDVLEILYTL